MSRETESLLNNCTGWIVAICLLGVLCSDISWERFAALGAAIIALAVYVVGRIAFSRWYRP